MELERKIMEKLEPFKYNFNYEKRIWVEKLNSHVN